MGVTVAIRQFSGDGLAAVRWLRNAAVEIGAVTGDACLRHRREPLGQDLVVATFDRGGRELTRASAQLILGDKHVALQGWTLLLATGTDARNDLFVGDPRGQDPDDRTIEQNDGAD